MRDLGKVVLHIPAREGSKRVPRKNIRLMAGKPMISYALTAALESAVTKNIYLNTDAQEIIDYITAEFPQVKVYKRDKSLASDTASSDEFNMDVINSLTPDTLIMINPVCPLIEASDISAAVTAYRKSNADTLITCSETKMQAFCEGNSVNINVNEALAPSQLNPAVQILNWAITIWDAAAFSKRFRENGYAVLGQARYLFPIDHLKSFKVSELGDFKVCEALIETRKS